MPILKILNLEGLKVRKKWWKELNYIDHLNQLCERRLLGKQIF